MPHLTPDKLRESWEAATAGSVRTKLFPCEWQDFFAYGVGAFTLNKLLEAAPSICSQYLIIGLPMPDGTCAYIKIYLLDYGPSRNSGHTGLYAWNKQPDNLTIYASISVGQPQIFHGFILDGVLRWEQKRI